MNPLDAIVLLLFAIGLVAGARAGFLGPVLGLAGALVGFLVALVLASVLREPLAQIEQPMRAVVTILGLGALVLMGEALGAAFGAQMSHALRHSPFRPFDALGGAVVGAAHVLLLVWLVGGMLAMGITPSLGPTARESVAIRIASERLPGPLTVAGHLLALLDTTDLPPLFGGLEPPPAEPVELPADAEAAALAESAVASTVKVTSAGCGVGLAVGSGFFVSPTHAITNAHVVAGGRETTVTVGGSVLSASVVAFDPVGDLAVLHVAEASAPPLELTSTAPARGWRGVVLGFPGGGDLTVTAAGVTAAHDIAGPDIYGQGVHARSVVELQAEIRRGNSGGPLVVEPGVVGGIVFGGSRLSPEVGYAIGADEAASRVGAAFGSTTPVPTGPCL